MSDKPASLQRQPGTIQYCVINWFQSLQPKIKRYLNCLSGIDSFACQLLMMKSQSVFVTMKLINRYRCFWCFVRCWKKALLYRHSSEACAQEARHVCSGGRDFFFVCVRFFSVACCCYHSKTEWFIIYAVEISLELALCTLSIHYVTKYIHIDR